MNKILTKGLIPVALTAVLAACGSDDKKSNKDNLSAGTGDISYTLTFEQTWNGSDFPTNYPSGAHFSPMFGATHNSQAIIWRPGGQPASTAGVKQLAETGRTDILNTELTAMKSSGYVDQIFKRDGGPVNSPGTQTAEVKVSEQFPMVSALSMIAPSPDWFVGIRDVNLFQNGEWVERMEFNLALYDADSDLGQTFAAANQEGGNRNIHLVTTTASETDFENGVHRNNDQLFVGKMILVRQQ